MTAGVQMNGEPLPRDHGSPVRVLVPGSIGARSVKWVNSVRVSPDEAEACWNSVYYKGGDGAYVETCFCGTCARAEHTHTHMPDRTSLTQMPIQSLILSPVQGQRVAGHSVRVQGIAWGGGSGNAIERVEVGLALCWQDVHVCKMPRLLYYARYQRTSRHGTRQS